MTANSVSKCDFYHQRGHPALTDVAIKRLKPKDKIYKFMDRDGMYVSVALSGRITFRYDYRLNRRCETLTFGHYGNDGITLAEAR